MNVEQLAKLAAGRCWAGYEPVPGKKPYSNDSCRPVGSKKKKKAEKKAADPRMAFQGVGGTPKNNLSDLYQKSVSGVARVAENAANSASAVLPSIGNAIGGLPGSLAGTAAGQQMKHEAGNLGVALGSGNQRIPAGYDMRSGTVSTTPSQSAVSGAIENDQLRNLLSRIKSGAANTPCSCNCGDTVATCKCGPDCKCRKQGGSCYKGEKAANVLEALAGGLSSGVSALTEIQRKQAEEKEKLERAVARYTRERLARRIAADKVASEKGLWANIHAKRKRGEKPAKPGDKDYPDSKSWKKTVKSSSVAELAIKAAAKSPAWQRSEGKNSEGGLNAKGRASYNKATGGNLKAPVTQKNPKGKAKSRRASFCARMGGMKSKLTGEKAKNDPDSRINKALRKWNC